MKSYISLLLLASLALTAQALNTRYFDGKSYAPVRSQSNFGGNSVNNYHNGDDAKRVQILRNDQQMNNDGTYHYEYQTANGISGQEQGTGGVAVQGSSSYISPEGIEIKLSYTADETGYHPVGDHIPKTPDYVFRALEYIRTHPYQVKNYYNGQTKPRAAVPRISTEIAPPPVRSSKSRNRLAASKNYNSGSPKSATATKSQYQSRNNLRRFRF